MSLILNLDTALTLASVSLAREGRMLASRTHDSQKTHAEFLQAAVQQLMEEQDVSFNDLDAIAVTAGPGSYTGIRVGMASAKGFAFALEKPFITVNTLETMAHAAREEAITKGYDLDWICPMIDARRMEVFTAMYNQDLQEMQAPHARILDTSSYQLELTQQSILFTGSGAEKWQAVNTSPRARFISVTDLSSSLCAISHQRFQEKKFTDLILSEPYYVKEFFNPAQ